VASHRIIPTVMAMVAKNESQLLIAITILINCTIIFYIFQLRLWKKDEMKNKKAVDESTYNIKTIHQIAGLPWAIIGPASWFNMLEQKRTTTIVTLIVRNNIEFIIHASQCIQFGIPDILISS
jgi:uncharacterized membrane protein